ncbi:O-antigen polysaccharide polymerase Wzy [Microbacterium plantarum]|uniref:O-antigen polysaccharide polymerase Wzy n=1 Tax=Microbacterium plantarum TaxID=1816425 RepID=UPI002B485163|nr:O-antigen polysaccharide polymerase Wzy [Microbacterium plantarum]WRK16104.1 O-antigen polysaccharide polymerase Wzy [Microbacterium plantarum]
MAAFRAHEAHDSATHRQGKTAPFLATYVGLALCVAVPLVVVEATESAAPIQSWPWAIVSMVISGARFTWIIGSATRRLYELMTWLFFYIFLGLAPLVQLRLATDPGTTPNLLHQYDGTAWAIVLASEVCLIAGSSFGKRNASREIHEPRRRLSGSRATSVSMLLLLLSAAYIGLIGASNLLVNREARNLATESAVSDEALRTLLIAFVTVGLLVAVVSQYELFRRRRAAGVKAPIMLASGSTAILILLVNPFASARFILAVAILGLLAAGGFFRSMGRYRIAAVASVVGLVTVFPILDSFRRESSVLEQSNPLEDLLSGDFDGFGQIVNTAWSVDTFGLTWGLQLLGVALFFVPRALWPTKPVDTGILLAEQKGYVFQNLSAPLPAEAFINFGWPGVIIAMLAIGIVLRRADERNEAQMRVWGAPTVLGSVIPFYLIFLWRGSLLQAVANLAVIMLVWWLCTESTSRRSPSAASRRSGARPAPLLR